MITQYIDALAGHDPSRLPLADNVRFTEDSKALKPGEGLWQTTTGKASFRQDYLDTKKQVAATHIAVPEGQNQALCSVLLYVKDMKITGIETLVEHITPKSRIQPNQLGAPIRGMDDPVPAGKKQSRESLIRTALTYTEGLRIGNFTDAGTPFAPETYRVENGVIKEVLARLANGEDVPPSEYYMRTSAKMEVKAGSKYDWLNKSVIISTGMRKANSVVIHFYRVL